MTMEDITALHLLQLEITMGMNLLISHQFAHQKDRPLHQLKGTQPKGFNSQLGHGFTLTLV